MMLDTMDYMVAKVLRDMGYSKDEEIHISANINAILTWHKTDLVKIICDYHSRSCPPNERSSGLPNNKGGIYIIYKNDIAYYVGIAANSLKQRFKSRLRFIRELGFSSGEVNKLGNRDVFWATIVAKRQGGGNVRRVNKKKRKITMLKPTDGTLLALEQHLIKKLNTLRRGNRATEDVIFTKNKQIKVTNTGVGIPPLITKALKDPINISFRPK